MSDDQTDINDTDINDIGIDDDVEGHGFIPASAREREIDDAEGHAVNYRPLDKSPQS